MKTAQTTIENTLQAVLLFLSLFFMLTVILSPLALFTMLGLLVTQLVSSIDRASNGKKGGYTVFYILYWIFAGIGAVATIWLLFAGEIGITYRVMLGLLAVMLCYFIVSLTDSNSRMPQYQQTGYMQQSFTGEYQAQLWQAHQNEMARQAWENAQAWNNYYQQYYAHQQIKHY
jgi:ABC-type transport system involved in multi-copper enzyme maturation permease subunit